MAYETQVIERTSYKNFICFPLPCNGDVCTKYTLVLSDMTRAKDIEMCSLYLDDCLVTEVLPNIKNPEFIQLDFPEVLHCHKVSRFQINVHFKSEFLGSAKLLLNVGFFSGDVLESYINCSQRYEERYIMIHTSYDCPIRLRRGYIDRLIIHSNKPLSKIDLIWNNEKIINDTSFGPSYYETDINEYTLPVKLDTQKGDLDLVLGCPSNTELCIEIIKPSELIYSYGLISINNLEGSFLRTSKIKN